MKRPSSAWLWVGLSALLLAAVPWAQRALESNLSERRARQAWELRRGDVLLDSAPSELERARGLFLEGRFADALLALRELSGDEALALRRRAEEALVLDVPWPERVVQKLTVDLDGDGLGELVRVVDPGFEEAARLEVFLPKREYAVVEPEFRRPGGEPLDKQPDLANLRALRTGNLTGRADAVLRTASNLVILVRGPVAYVFSGKAQLEEDGVRSDGLWRWQSDRFQAAGS